MAVELRRASLRDRLDYYIKAQANGAVEYAWQGLWTTLLGNVPGLLGIGLRGIGYRLILRSDGMCAIESDVRLRHARNIRLGHGVYLDRGVYLHATPGGISIGDRSTIMHNTELHVFNFRNLPHAFINIGCDTFVGESVVVRGQGGVTIGDSVLIAPQVKILAVNHNFDDVSRPVIEQGISGRGIVVEDGAWLGAGAAILDGVTIGRGAVIGANAVVTRDVPPYSVAVGAPAHVVKQLRDDARRTVADGLRDVDGLGALNLLSTLKQ